MDYNANLSTLLTQSGPPLFCDCLACVGRLCKKIHQPCRLQFFWLYFQMNRPDDDIGLTRSSEAIPPYDRQGVLSRGAYADAVGIVLLLRHELHGVGDARSARRTDLQRPPSRRGPKGPHGGSSAARRRIAAGGEWCPSGPNSAQNLPGSSGRSSSSSGSCSLGISRSTRLVRSLRSVLYLASPVRRSQ